MTKEETISAVKKEVKKETKVKKEAKEEYLDEDPISLKVEAKSVEVYL